jgi:Trk K+ transport system NAD-binding subunit
MNILFVVGSADRGTNGVGDYTRRIAAELETIGHQVLIIATHDRKATR